MSRCLQEDASISGSVRLLLAGAVLLQGGCLHVEESGGDTPSGVQSDGGSGPDAGDAGSTEPDAADAGMLPDGDDAGHADAGTDPTPPYPVGTSEQIQMVDGVERTFTLHVPAAAGAAPKALVLVLHGGGGSGSTPTETGSALSVFIDVADREGFVVAFPGGSRTAMWSSRRSSGTTSRVVSSPSHRPRPTAARGVRAPRATPRPDRHQ